MNRPTSLSTLTRRFSLALTLLATSASVCVGTAAAQHIVAAPALSPLALAASPKAFAGASVVAPMDFGASSVQPGLIAGDTASSSVELPDDPSAQPYTPSEPFQNNNMPHLASTPGHPVAKVYTKYIPAGWAAQPLTNRQKVILGLRDTYSPFSFSAMFLSAGYEQVLDGEPDYGVDRGAFGERLGAAAIRETTQGIFTDAVFAPLLHEDSRYYVEGEQYGFIHRVFYAATRTIVTRTDSGRSSVNAALLLGYAASSGLSYTYYPAKNQNFGDTASTFGGAIGGAALGFLVSEFSSDIWTTLHLQKKQK